MSVRQTEELASEASRFSLRSLFPMSITMRTQVSDPVPPPVPQQLSQPSPQFQPHPFNAAASKSQLRFNLPLNATASQPAAAPEPAFRFSLPTMVHANKAASPVESASHAEFRPTALTGVSPPTHTPPLTMTEVHAIPVDVHDAEIARLVQTQVELGEKLKLSEAKLATTSSSVIRGNQALATERAQFKQKILAMNEEANEILAREKCATEALGLRADQSAEIQEMKLLVEKHAAQHAAVSQDYLELVETFDGLKKVMDATSAELDSKTLEVTALTADLETLQVQAETAEQQIDKLDLVIAELRAAPTSSRCGSAHAQADPEAPQANEEEANEEEAAAAEAAEAAAAVATGANVGGVPMVICIKTCCEGSPDACCKVEKNAKEARAHLAKRLHDRPCRMGIRLVGDDDAPMNLHLYTETGAPSDGLQSAHVASSKATDATIRTNAYVNLVSKDIKKHMTGQRDLWVQTAAIGVHAL